MTDIIGNLCVDCKTCSVVYATRKLCRACYNRAAYKFNPVAKRTANREWNHRNKARVLKTSRAWNAANSDRLRLTSKQWHQRNRPKRLRDMQTYYSQHYEQFLQYSHTRRARIANAPRTDFTAEQWTALRKKHKYRCFYCGLKKPLTIDHRVPLARGGSHTKSNIVPACLFCNQQKHTKTDVEYLRILRRAA